MHQAVSQSGYSFQIYNYYSYIFLNIKLDTYTQNCYMTIAFFFLENTKYFNTHTGRWEKNLKKLLEHLQQWSQILAF